MVESDRLFASVEEAISVNTGIPFELHSQNSLSGGCINQSSRIQAKDGTVYFVKRNGVDFFPFFYAEAEALREIGSTHTIRVPQVISVGKTSEVSFLVLEYLELGSGNNKGQKELGKQLAKLHRIKQPCFGWNQDNCIGATPQPNPKTEDWIDFYRNHRLNHQFKLSEQKGKRFNDSEKLLEQIDFFFDDYLPHPSLLHGDLWGGNAACDTQGTPFIFDPASYYGDRESDIAFTYMFGGFSPAFYEAYENHYPLDQGFRHRKTLYNLYHELNHFNLFGGGYAQSAQSSINELLRLLP